MDYFTIKARVIGFFSPYLSYYMVDVCESLDLDNDYSRSTNKVELRQEYLLKHEIFMYNVHKNFVENPIFLPEKEETLEKVHDLFE